MKNVQDTQIIKMSSKKEAMAFELWKQKESERCKELQRQDMRIFIEKIGSQWSAQQSKVSKEWSEKESAIADGFNKIGLVVSDYKNAVAEKQALEKQLRQLDQEIDQLKRGPSENNRQQRLTNINALRLEIEKLTDELSKSDQQLREANEKKAKYKRRFCEASQIVRELEEEEAKRKQRRRLRMNH